MARSTPVLSGLNLVARDMDATLAFYRELGIELPVENIWQTESGIHHVEASTESGLDLDFDSPELAAAYNSGYNTGNTAECNADSAKATHNQSVIGFSLSSRDEVDERYAALIAAGHAGLQTPYDAFWGARYAVVEDPDGRHVGLMSPVDAARKMAPPSL